MRVSVEFYGLARLRAGVGRIALELPDKDACLADVFDSLAERLPAFREHCLSSGRLAEALTCNLDGQRFVSEAATPLASGQTVLILSADAGG